MQGGAREIACRPPQRVASAFLYHVMTLDGTANHQWWSAGLAAQTRAGQSRADIGAMRPTRLLHQPLFPLHFFEIRIPI